MRRAWDAKSAKAIRGIADIIVRNGSRRSVFMEVMTILYGTFEADDMRWLDKQWAEAVRLNDAQAKEPPTP